MTTDQVQVIAHLTDRHPTLSAEEMVEHLIPPRQFRDASLDSYRPDPDYPSQGEAVAAIREFLDGWDARSGGGLFSRKKTADALPGIYLDGGFGVGKTHLLASLWHQAPGRKYFGTFIEYTALVGALGYEAAAGQLRGASLICIDEFELDDPGDTRLMSRLLSNLSASGTRMAATSNTPPHALGEGLFAAADFLREIDALASRFRTQRIDGVDYRRRDIEGHAITLSETELSEQLEQIFGQVTVDGFDEILHHLASVHPSKYAKLVDGLSAIGVIGAHGLTNQTDALRLVAFVDRLYDAQVRILASGIPLDEVFAEDMLAGGYRKKYLRAVSRMIALTSGTD
ncbi:cell division protein ZapE [soil metagenome]